MSPSPPALVCLGLCLGQAIQAQHGLLPKPSLQALPSSLVPLEKPVTLRCQGPPGVDLYRLERLRPRKYEDQAVLFIPAMRQDLAGQYRCSYQNGSRWSAPSELLDLVATGVYEKPSLSAQPGPAVSPGGDVTLQCHSKYSFNQYALYKKGDSRPYRGPERWYRAHFPIITVTAAHSGTYQCYSFSSRSPYLWSAPSDPLELVVTGITEAPRRLRTDAPTDAPTEAPTDAPTDAPTEVPTEVPTDAPTSATGLARQSHAKGNLVQICLGAAILLLLVGILVEDWHSRKTCPPGRGRAAHRPLPPVPRAQRAPGRGEGPAGWS